MLIEHWEIGSSFKKIDRDFDNTFGAVYRGTVMFDALKDLFGYERNRFSFDYCLDMASGRGFPQTVLTIRPENKNDEERILAGKTDEYRNCFYLGKDWLGDVRKDRLEYLDTKITQIEESSRVNLFVGEEKLFGVVDFLKA